MKYKIGDKPWIRADLKEGQRYGTWIIGGTLKQRKRVLGKQCTIITICDGTYRLKEDCGDYWTDEMFTDKKPSIISRMLVIFK
jgi:hypothetical protein